MQHLYRHHNREGIHFADIEKKRMPNGLLTEAARKAFDERRDIAELTCLICGKYLIYEEELYHCYWCGVAGEVVLVVDRRLSEDDPQRLSIRLLQQRTLTLKAWLQAQANNGFLIGYLPCPSCDQPMTQLIEQESGVRPACCDFVFIPEIGELSYRKKRRGKHIPRWKVYYESVEKVASPHPKTCKIKCIDLHTYQSAFEHFAPDIPVPAAENVSPSETQVAQDTEVSQTDAESNTPTDNSKAKTLHVRGREALILFIRKHIRADPNAILPSSEAYSAYVDWIQEHQQKPLSDRLFHKSLQHIYKSLEFKQNRIDGKRVWCYRGIKVRS